MLKARTCTIPLLAAAAALLIASSALADTPALVFSRGTARLFARSFTRNYLRSDLTLTGKVVNAGSPAANATIVAYSSPNQAGPYAPIASTLSDVTGHFKLMLGQSDSRFVEVTVDGAPPVTFHENVRASLTLHIKPLSNARMRFTGQITVAPDGAIPWVILQDLTPIGWQEFGAEPVAAAERFRYTYRALASAIGSGFQFRAYTIAGAGYLANASPVEWATFH